MVISRPNFCLKKTAMLGQAFYLEQGRLCDTRCQKNDRFI